MIAHTMVWKLGMGPSGFVGDYSSIPENEISEAIKNQLNQDTHKIVQQCLKDVEALLMKERELFERFAQELLAKQELEYDEIEAIFAEYGKANPRHFRMSQEEQKKEESKYSGGTAVPNSDFKDPKS